jgi:hypothetical protein
VNRTRRLVLAVGSVLVAVVLATGIVYGTSGNAEPAKDSLVLNGHAPRSMELGVTLSTGGSFRTSGTITINATTSSLSAVLQVPVVTADTTFYVRAVKDRVYLTSPNLADASGPVWYTLAAKWPPLAGLAHYLVKPNAAVLTLLANARVVHHGHETTYELHRTNVALGALRSSGRTISANGTLDVRLTTGRQGEFTELWIATSTKTSTTTVDLRVLSYNQTAIIVVPPKSRSTTSASPLLQQLLSSGALGSLVLPSQVLQALSRAKLS